MNSLSVPFDLKVKMLNVAKCRLDSSWNYSDLTSPFSRIYFIKSGKGAIYPNGQKIYLEAGYLYLIPGYIPCSYYCPESLFQYYLHFTTELNDGLNIFDLFSSPFKTIAHATDIYLFERLLEINPDAGLRVTDPSVYQAKSWINRRDENDTIAQLIETNGIVFQLISRFLENCQTKESILSSPPNRFKEILTYIQNHLDQTITINDLAGKAQMSGDHFTRSFKKETGQLPLEYIIQKRIEKSQLLLVTTNLSINDIISKTGFNSPSYFSRIFKSVTGLTPLEYRRFHQSHYS